MASLGKPPVTSSTTLVLLHSNKYHNDWSFLDLPLYIIYTVEDKICLMEI